MSHESEMKPVAPTEPIAASKPQAENFKPDNIDDLNPISNYLTYWFASRLVSRAADSNRTISMEDLWAVPSSERVDELARKFDDIRSRDPNRGYIKPAVHVSWNLIVTGGFFLLLKTVAEVFMPVLVREIVKRVQNKEFEGLYFVLAFLGVGVVGQISNQMHLRCMELGANRIRAVSNYVIFRHALKLRSCAFGEGLADVVTLVASDTQRFVDLHAYFHLVWASPLQIIIGTYFMVQFISYSGFIAVGAMLLLYPYSFAISAIQSRVRMRLLPLMQQRVRQISEFLQGVRVCKMYGWEPYLIKVIEETRAAEVACMMRELLLWVCSTSFLISIPPVALCLTFIHFIETEGALTAADVFGALSMLTLLKFPLMYFGTAIMVLMQVRVGCIRVDTFLKRENVYKADDAVCSTPRDDTDEANPAAATAASEKKEREGDDDESDAVVSLKGCDFTWTVDAAKELQRRDGDVSSGASSGNDDRHAIFQLRGFTVQLRRGECCAILGAVGAGKTMAITSLLQETYLSAGSQRSPQVIALAAQEPFLMSGTVRENILFFRPFDEELYRKVLDACQLWQDLEAYGDGEMTIVGERGVTLSGGQKARIALARAVYARDADLVLIDDCFAALDARTGKLVLEALLSRPNGMLRRQAVVMVTHARGNLWAADHILELQGGDIVVSPTSPSADALAGGGDTPVAAADAVPGDAPGDHSAQRQKLATVTQNKLVAAEHAEGTVASRTYMDFFRSGGGWIFVLATFLGLAIERCCFAGGDIWLSIWTSAEKGKPTHAIGEANDFPAGDNYDGARFYLRVYAGIVSITFVLGCLRLSIFATGGTKAAMNLFSNAFRRLTRCPMAYFDSTPTGRILNRMSFDVERVGYPLITQLNGTFATTGWLVTGVAMAAAIVPYTLLILIPAIVIMGYLLFRFRAINVHLQRLDAIARSNLQSHIFESVTGAVTIRSLNQSGAFLRLCRGFVDDNTRSLWAVAMCQRWLSIRAELLAVLMMFSIALLVWILRDTIPGGQAGVSIVWGMNVARSVSFAITEGVQGEAKLVSVERLVDFIENLPQEPPRVIEGKQPDASWPQHGRIEFRNVSMRYREGLPLVLDNCSFVVEAGTRCGIVGRTGSGKSSTIVALFRLREVVSGSIVIDGVDIGEIGLDGIRGGGISIVPQDPILFSGTVRSNIDPFNQYDDERVKQSLQAVQLWDYVATIGGLQAVVEERGRNFSVGQRQLICVCRALLRNPTVLAMDEATANIDNETDLLIQRTVRELFANTTVVEIAHRLHTVMDADKVIVMGEGHVVESGAPADLIDAGGVFTSMVDATGAATAAELREMAKEAATAKVRAK